MVPPSLPALPEVITIQFTLLLAVQLQLLPAVTLMLPLPPLASKDWLWGEIE